MKIYKILSILILCGFTGCEIQDVSNSFVDDNSTSKLLSAGETNPVHIEPVNTDEISPIIDKQFHQIRKETDIKLDEKKPPPLRLKEVVTPSIQPKFSKELLQAVGNWQKIPKSVFPLKNVSIREPVTFKLLGKNGQIMASIPFLSGKEVVAKSIVGTNLLISPTVASKLEAKISFENTDFQECVAFRFEMGKKIIKMRNATKNKSQNASNTSDSKNEKRGTADKGELLIPGDFGHGKFCICSDCRQKRLALTGSMK